MFRTFASISSLLLTLLLGRAEAGPPKLAANDVTWLWPVPSSLQELPEVIAVASLVSTDGTPVWSDQHFSDLLTTADSDASKVDELRIGLPEAVRKKDVWRVVAFRADPTAPGGHEIIRQNLGEKPQLRLVLQPVTTDGDRVNIHDIAVHLVFDFVRPASDQSPEQPDRERFREIVAGLDELKQFSKTAGVDTSGKPLGVHPALAAKIPGLDKKVREFLSKHLHTSRLSAMALMGLDHPEPWIFIPMSKSSQSGGRFGSIPILPAQMLSFRAGDGVVSPAPRVNNLSDASNKFPMPAEAKDRRGVATAAMFNDATFDPDAFAIVGVNEAGEPMRDDAIRNSDIPDVIADPLRSHFFNTDCISCHTETRRRIRFSLPPGPFAFRQDGEPPAIQPDVLPKHDWNVRNLGWFQLSEFVGGGPAFPTVTQRTANETAEVVEYIERNYRHEVTSDPNLDPGTPALLTPVKEVEFLDQGWTEQERQDFYYLSQGSQLLPFSWFICLELSESEKLIRSDDHMRSRGFIVQAADSGRNPDGLPIGVVKDSNPSSIEMKAGFLGSGYQSDDYPKTGEWLGLTCAACHTAEISFQGKKVRVDGGAANVDMERFLEELAKSMRATLDDEDKFDRFESRIKSGVDGDIDTGSLRAELAAYTPVIERLVERNKAKHPYGLGRLDAFGAILNQVCEAGLEIPENRRESNAPVSFPFLWDTPHMDWVQWNSSVDIPISRNVGEVMGVFAQTKLTGTPAVGQFSSSARLDYLLRLETQLGRLRAPAWPSEVFGEIDESKAIAGKKLFSDHCAKCHNMRDDKGNFAMTEPNEFGRTFIKTRSVPFKHIGTDPQMVINFVTRTAKPGALSTLLAPTMAEPETKENLEKLSQVFTTLGLEKPEFSQTPPAAMLLSAAVGGVIKRDLDERFQNRTDDEIQQMSLELRGFRSAASPPNGGMGYKARPLNGVWATAPFGHAGAVPTLHQWLLPEGERVKSFTVGSREFDPKNVGFVTEENAELFTFRVEAEDGTAIPGNSNKGHSGPDHTDFNDEERWQIIEYLKTCK